MMLTANVIVPKDLQGYFVKYGPIAMRVISLAMELFKGLDLMIVVAVTA